LRRVVGDASPEWRSTFQERQQLRREYATLTLQGGSSAQQPSVVTAAGENPALAHGLATRIEKLEQQLKADIFKEHSLWLVEKAYFAEVEDALQSERQRIQDKIDETI